MHHTKGSSRLQRVKWLAVAGLFIALFSACASNPKQVAKAIPQDHLAEISRPEIPLVVNDRVQDWLNYFQGPGHDRFQRFLARSGKYIPMMKKILKEHGMPESLVYLAMIESGFNPHAYSHASAMGAWQFIYQTGIRYGLKADSWIDERRDPKKSTVAAAKYLRDLYDRFNNWYLAAAGYNAGEGKVGRAIRKYATEDFWELAKGKYLKAETKDYVPKLIAAALIAKNPDKYGFKNIQYEEPVTFEEVIVHGPIDLRIAAKCAGIAYEQVKTLNPELLHWVTPPHSKEYTLKLPAHSAAKFRQTYAGLNAAEKLGGKKIAVDETISVEKLAYRHGLPSILLASANDIDPDGMLKAGQKISLPMDPPEGEEYYETNYLKKSRHGRHRRGGSGSAVAYKIRPGDSPQKVARKLGVSVAALKASNPGINWSRLRSGQRVKLYAANTSPKPRRANGKGKAKVAMVERESSSTHKIRRGDTLSDIAKRYNVSVKELKQVNGIDNHKIKAGKLIQIPGQIPGRQQASVTPTL